MSIESEVFMCQAKQSGRFEVASQIKLVLAGIMQIQGLEDTREATPEEKEIWEIVKGLSERMGATLEKEQQRHF